MITVMWLEHDVEPNDRDQDTRQDLCCSSWYWPFQKYLHLFSIFYRQGQYFLFWWGRILSFVGFFCCCFLVLGLDFLPWTLEHKVVFFLAPFTDLTVGRALFSVSFVRFVAKLDMIWARRPHLIPSSDSTWLEFWLRVGCDTRQLPRQLSKVSFGSWSSFLFLCQCYWTFLWHLLTPCAVMWAGPGETGNIRRQTVLKTIKNLRKFNSHNEAHGYKVMWLGYGVTRTIKKLQTRWEQLQIANETVLFPK